MDSDFLPSVMIMVLLQIGGHSENVICAQVCLFALAHVI